MSFDCDLLVIGAGSGGVRAARLAAKYGKKVVLVERDRLGGTCVNVGCIPKKLLSYASHYADDFRDAAGFGWQLNKPVLDWPTLIQNKNVEVARLNEIYRNLLVNAGVTLIAADAHIIDPNTVKAGEQLIRAKRILLAVGGAPWKPDVAGKEHAITSNEFFELPNLPKSCVVVGGGYIALELASILNGLGVHTQLLHRGDCVLREFDEDVRQFLAAEIQKKGISFFWQETIKSIDKTAVDLTLICESGKKIHADCVLYAIGRKPVLNDLGLENTTVERSASGYIRVNEQYQTQEPSIYAIGDAVGFKALTPVAIGEATWLVDFLYGTKTRVALNYSMVPSAVFSQPAVASVGLTQQQAEAKCGAETIICYKSEFRALKYTLSGSNERVLMKLVVHKPTDSVLGLHMVGQDAGEIVQGFAVAVQMGVTKAQFDAVVAIHPTAAEEFVTMQ